MHRTFNSTGGPKANKTKTQTHLCTNYERQKPPNRQLNFQFEVEIQFDLNILFSADGSAVTSGSVKTNRSLGLCPDKSYFTTSLTWSWCVCEFK